MAVSAPPSAAVEPIDVAIAPARRHLRRRIAIAAGGVVVGLLGVVGALCVHPAIAMRDDFARGRDRLTSAQAELSSGEFAAAARDFSAARATFRVPGGVGGLALRAAAHVPYFGRTPRALLELSAIGWQVAGAGTDVGRQLARLPGGLAALAPADGRIRLDDLRRLSPAVHRARVTVDEAAARAALLPDSWVLGPVARAVDVVRDRLATAAPAARSADDLLRAMPSFAGANGPRRYFVAVQNTAELRGTGGLIGNYAILTMDRGAISLSPFRDAGELRNLPPEAVTAPSRQFARLYDDFGGTGFWLNVNMTPDAPTAATVIESLYRRVSGEQVDGVVFFDLQGLADLLRATGPVRVPALDATYDASTVVKAVADSSYLHAAIPDPFQEGPRDIAEAVWSRFLSGTEPRAALDALSAAASDGHLMVESAEPSVQRALRTTGVTGPYRDTGDDTFGVVLSNAAANKVDYYLHEDVRYDVTLGAGGTGTASAGVDLRNGAPAGAAPDYTLGPSDASQAAGLHLSPGEDRWWAQLYCASTCRATSATADGARLPLEQDRENGLTMYGNFLQAAAQGDADVRLRLELPRAWKGDDASGRYRLVLHGQPTVQPSSATVVVHAPPGMTITWTGVPMRVDGGVATWTGSVGRERTFEVRFQRGFDGRVWARIWGFLSRPALRV